MQLKNRTKEQLLELIKILSTDIEFLDEVVDDEKLRSELCEFIGKKYSAEHVILTVETDAVEAFDYNEFSNVENWEVTVKFKGQEISAEIREAEEW